MNERWVIYKTIDVKTQKIYIGQHKCQECSIGKDCGYRGSSLIIKAIKKKRPKTIFKETIEIVDSEEKANEREIYWISEFNSNDPKIGYNRSVGGSAYKTFISNCINHGDTRFSQKGCIKCLSLPGILASYMEGQCFLHGDVILHSGNCMTCENLNHKNMQICSLHGDTKFQGDSCCKCNVSSIFSTGECANHGNVSLRNGNCINCQAESRIVLKKVYNSW